VFEPVRPPAQKVAMTLHVSMGRVYLARHRVGRLLKKAIGQLRREVS
jgi:hypothetical protein